MSSSALRQFFLSRSIPTEPQSISCADLHGKLIDNGFLVTRRTVQRDLNDLSIILDVQCRKIGKMHYWYLSKR